MAKGKMITRTITATIIKSGLFEYKEGKGEINPQADITISGSTDLEKATKEIRKIYGYNAEIIELVQIEDVYEISIEDFMKYATKIKTPFQELTSEV